MKTQEIDMRIVKGFPWLKGDSMAGTRCMEVNWGREKLPCCGGEGTLSKMERAFGRVRHWVYRRSKLLGAQTEVLGKLNGTDFFANNEWGSSLEILEVQDFQ